MDITKDSEKVVCYLYRSFLKRRDDGISKSAARVFDEDFWLSNKKLSKWNDEDIEESLEELEFHNYIKRDIFGNITLTDSTIVYMEGRFSRGLASAWDIISDFLL